MKITNKTLPEISLTFIGLCPGDVFLYCGKAYLKIKPLCDTYNAIELESYNGVNFSRDTAIKHCKSELTLTNWLP